MIAAIIFFTALFVAFAYYYFNFLIKQLWIRKRIVVDRVVEVRRIHVNPIELRSEFVIPEYQLKHIIRRNMSEIELIRKLAAERVSSYVFNLVEKDINNEVFPIIEHVDRRNRSAIFEDKRHFTVDFKLLPIMKIERFNDKHLPYKYVQP